ncbi:enoyl-CoA hydratase-related protein [Blastococcus sp. URHD0036]|uniref:enoyl-CoA hydratase-related protein n=1 Tax=Blastococcus sp. URHD0036 TaxID=1380356 RepID=UPI00068E11F3
MLVETSEGRVRILRLNRPERANSLNAEPVTNLAGALAAAKADPDVWVVIVTGTGTTFCAGGDLKEMAPRTPGRPGRCARRAAQCPTSSSSPSG